MLTVVINGVELNPKQAALVVTALDALDEAIWEDRLAYSRDHKELLAQVTNIIQYGYTPGA